jgi:hypothetical protein
LEPATEPVKPLADAQTKAAGTARETVELAIEKAKLAGLGAGGLTDIWTVLPGPCELPDIWTMAAGNASAAEELFTALAGFGGLGS